MLPTKALLEQWFKQFNASYFNNTLPLPRLSLSKAHTRLGTMSCKRRFGLTGRRYTDFNIRISIYYDCDERCYQTILLHEMIHYYIAYTHQTDNAPHGERFQAYMKAINSHGWNITVSTRTRGWAVRSNIKRKRQRLLLQMQTHEGDILLTVVSPRYAQHLEQSLKHVADQVATHAWYVSTDDRFATYPTVRTLRGRRITAADWQTLLPLLSPFTLPTI